MKVDRMDEEEVEMVVPNERAAKGLKVVSRDFYDMTRSGLDALSIEVVAN